MADKLDPHHMVALMNYVFRGKQDRSSQSLDPSSFNAELGNTNKRGTSAHTFHILDAIASICAFKKGSKAVAVALQLDPKNQKIRLTIAGNQEVESCLVDHLERVWGNLQALSNELSTESESDKNEEASPDVSQDMSCMLMLKIFRELYQLTMEKQRRREAKWLGDLGSFANKLAKRRIGVLQGSARDVCEILTGLEMAREVVDKVYHCPSYVLTEDEWLEVYGFNIWFIEKAELVLEGENNLDCESLAQELNGMPLSLFGKWVMISDLQANFTSVLDSPLCPEKAFRLRHALEKLTSLARHIQYLISLTASHRFRHVLQYHMSISTVPGQTRTVELPESQDQWKPFLEIAAGRKFRWQEVDAVKLARYFKKNILVCPAHCECVLAQYLTAKHSDTWDNIPAFSYIGTSKLTCSACSIWLEAFNEVGQRTFYTQGSDGKWYWPWGMPQGGESLTETMARVSLEKTAPRKSLEESMAAKISSEYIRHLNRQGLYIPDSNSRYTSWSSERQHLSDARMQVISSKLAAYMQKFSDNTELHSDSIPSHPW